MAFYWIPTHSRPVWIGSGWQCDGNANKRCNSSIGLMLGVLLLWSLHWWLVEIIFAFLGPTGQHIWKYEANSVDFLQSQPQMLWLFQHVWTLIPPCRYWEGPKGHRWLMTKTFSGGQFSPPSKRKEAMIYLGCVPLGCSTSWEHVILNINL